MATCPGASKPSLPDGSDSLALSLDRAASLKLS
jgi:hypothetical protein